MYKILVADDEPLVLQSMEKLIARNFGETCEVRTAKTGRMVIEQAEEFRPDIAVMDIQMPGINGIDAMQEIRKFSPRTKFIVMSAYDNFDYAHSAIEIGVLEYLTKPANAKKIVEALEHGMEEVKNAQQKRESELKNKEKLETVIPIIESGMIYTILFQDDYAQDLENFNQLLDMEPEYGYLMVVEIGDELKGRHMTNVVGTSVKAQKFYLEFREIVKGYFDGVVGPVMSNKVVIFVPAEVEGYEYNERLAIIEKSRNMIDKLKERIDMDFRVGIGAVHSMSDIHASYKEANHALKNSQVNVLHIKDLTPNQQVEEDYPFDVEHKMFHYLKSGNIPGMLAEAEIFYGWMTDNYSSYLHDIKLKVLELALYGERLAFETGGMSYSFLSRTHYWNEIETVDDYEHLGAWFYDKLKGAAQVTSGMDEKKFSGIVREARNYMEENFHREISLDEVSRLVNVSPYYFSKVFKEESGENFIEYLTKIRIDYAKKQLKNTNQSIKEICVDSGYGDPNYFSRIFKKEVGMTPSEFREGVTR